MQLKSKFTTREIALLSLLSALWAALEIYLGGFLKIFRIPFSGTLLTFLGLIIIFSGRNSVPKRGGVIIMGFTTAFLKLVYLGGLAIYPILGILIESLLVEISLRKQSPAKVDFLFAGSVGLLWSFFHPFFAQGVLAGWGLVRVYALVIERGAQFLGVDPNMAWLIFLALLLVHLGLGLLAGSFGWKYSRIILNRYQTARIHETA